MIKFLLGVVVGYAVQEELRKAVKLAVRGALRAQDHVQSSYAVMKEDITDAIEEERAARGKVRSKPAG